VPRREAKIASWGLSAAMSLRASDGATKRALAEGHDGLLFGSGRWTMAGGVTGGVVSASGTDAGRAAGGAVRVGDDRGGSSGCRRAARSSALRG
jgi:hypothetical protein